MRIISAILFAYLPLLAHAAPPVITDMRHEAGKVHLQWRHPSCWKFEVNWNGEGIQKLHFEAGRKGLRQFKWRAEPRQGTNTVAIRAISETGQPEEWVEHTLVVRERAKWDGVLPPDPLNPGSRSTQRSDLTPGSIATVVPVAAIDLTITWEYTGPITPNHVIYVFEAPDLRGWGQIATVPTSPKGGFTVPKRPYSFYRVQAVDQTTGLTVSGLTNVVMDP